MPADDTRARSQATFEGLFGRLYAYWMERPWLARTVGLALWGGDAKPYYDSMGAIGEMPADALVVDAPCGAGAAFDAVPGARLFRYLAIDLSPPMLERARQRAHSLGLAEIDLIAGDAEHIPLQSNSVDLFLSYWGLHCMPNPEAAVREIGRCLRPGGRVIGAMICRGPSLRQRICLKPGRGAFGPGGTVDDLARWLVDASLAQTRLETSGAFAFFEAFRRR
ncbi:MAG: class I SAM-dependent methyltransferase [Xanthobacteraceae bacterium]